VSNNIVGVKKWASVEKPGITSFIEIIKKLRFTKKSAAQGYPNTHKTGSPLKL
jgi:hypothetical protein